MPLPLRFSTRLVLALSLALGAALALTGSAFAVTPENDGADAVIAPPADDVDQIPGDAVAQARPGGGPKTSRGYDISYPQCGGAYPLNPAFAIVGVNRGLVFSANPCLVDQLRWGGDATAEVYINTGNPGPALSSHWPTGQTSPRFCDPANPDTADCAYDYGWYAAEQSYQTLAAGYAARGITTSPSATAWWLDVETSNSWRDDVTLNVAALSGEVDYLRTAGVTRLGFYSTTSQWGTITGATTVFAAYPSWGAGAPSERVARNLCTSTTTSFTGGRLALVQYPYQSFDADIGC